MRVVAQRIHPETPENLIARLANRLRRQALWDFLLIFLPPLIAGIHCATYLYRGTWITQGVFVLAVAAAAALTLGVVLYCYRLALPSLPFAAHLIDQRAGATDRFITLSTVDPGSCPAALFKRLRAEATGFLDRIKLRHDFPYKVKRSFYQSLVASLLFAAAFHLLLPVAVSRNSPVTVPERLRELAAKMEQRRNMADLARQLQSLAAKLQTPEASPQEKQRAIEEMENKIEEQQKKEEQKDNRDLLGQAASTLKGAEEQSGNGEQQEKNQKNGSGGVQSNLPQEGQGNTSPQNGGDGKDEGTAQLSKGAQEGKMTQAEPNQQGQDKGQQKSGEGKGESPEHSQADRDKSQDISGKAQGEREEKMGKDKASEDIPQGAPPAERLTRPGEQGNQGIKGARYVTVQLPEDVAADSKGESSGGKETKGNRVGPKLPVSNVPLPAHLPDAPTEKQQVPLEYRGLIH